MKPPKGVLKTITAIVGIAAAEAAANSQAIPLPAEQRELVSLIARVVMGVLAVFNLHRNPDGSPASEPYLKPSEKE